MTASTQLPCTKIDGFGRFESASIESDANDHAWPVANVAGVTSLVRR